mgnify:FL=1
MKTIHYLLTFILFLLVLSCQDEDIMSLSDGKLPSSQDPSTRTTGIASNLRHDADGYWVANRRVPLVGKGRIVDNISDALVSVAGWKENVGHMVDIDIANSTSFAGVVAADLLANQIASVRDMARTYAGGQTAGFVYKVDNTSLLTLAVLKGFWIQTLLKGVAQETQGGNTSGETLELNLLSAANDGGKQALSISTSFSKPFDEIRIGMNGVSADVLNALSLYYAFVGDNPMQACTTDNTTYFPAGVEIHKNGLFDSGWTSISNAERIIDADLTNGAGFGVIGGLLSDPHVTVNFKTAIPIGTEVGFCFTDATILDLSLLTGTVLETYDANNKKVDAVTINSLLGLSAIGGGKKQVSLIASKPCTQVRVKFTGVNINLGATIVNYAFVREPVEIDASSFISLTNTIIAGNTYQFPAPQSGTMTCQLVNYPNGATPQITDKNRITGMTVDGDYSVLVTYTTVDGATYSQTVVITRKAKVMEGADCNTLITATKNKAEAYTPAGGGSLISISDISGVNNILDDNPDNYAVYTKGVTLLGNIGILGIKTSDGSALTPSGREIRTGFTVQSTSSLLSLDALTFFRIRLKRNGTYLSGSSLTEDGIAVSAGLIGDDGTKMRLSIVTNQEFDAMELWSSGVATANLELKTFNLYNAFWEPTSSTCYSGNIGDACLELLTASNHGAEINYDETKTGAVASVGSSFNNLGNLLDDDRTSATEITNTTVVGGVTVAVKFNTVRTKAQVGFMLKKITGVADVELLNNIHLSVYSKGAKDNNSKNSWGVLGADVIGSGDYTYISTIPEISEFDEIRISFTGVAQALKNVLLTGVFIRPDTDGDGIPDCAEPGTNNDNPINSADATSKHICVESPVTINITGTDVLPTGDYTLEFHDITATSTVADKTITLGADHTLTVNDLPAGDYYINIKSVANANAYYNGVHVTVHPKETTWKQNAASTDWNTWANWSNGSPWDCTNVILPSGCTRYPELTNGADNYCQYIHFSPHAELVSTHFLHYQKAWVELSITPGRYYMLSAPLKEMVTGDIFIPQDLNGNQGTFSKFTSLEATNSPENRFNPRILQRIWGNSAPGRKLNGEVTVAINETNWTPPFNDLKYSYTTANGFSLLADKGSLASNTMTFRFPKEHTVYNYVNAAGHPTGITESITRSTAVAGRFIHEGTDGKVNFPLTVKVSSQKSSYTFLVGNPFMAHIDIAKFMAANPTITSVKVYDGNSNNSLIKLDGQLISNGSGYWYIAPMQSVFVTVGTSGTQLSVRFNEDMLCQVPGNSGQLRNAKTRLASNRNANISSALSVTATSAGSSATALLIIKPGASAAYVPGEDTELLLDNEVPPAIAVFSAANGKALDIQQLNMSARRIPLGVSLKKAGRVTLSLSHIVGDNWSKWTLVDTESGKRYPLAQQYEVTIDVGILQTHAGRFCLEKN